MSDQILNHTQLVEQLPLHRWHKDGEILDVALNIRTMRVLGSICYIPYDNSNELTLKRNRGTAIDVDFNKDLKAVISVKKEEHTGREVRITYGPCDVNIEVELGYQYRDKPFVMDSSFYYSFDYLDLMVGHDETKFSGIINNFLNFDIIDLDFSIRSH
jgi:hypothetical protein